MRSNKAKEKFIVIVRVKPLLIQEANYKQNEMENVIETTQTSVTILRKHNDEKKFKFNHVLDPAPQAELYSCSAHLAESIFSGHNATFLAYGQTGTGKTHSVFGGDGAEQGYLGKAIEDLFKIIDRRKHERQFKFYMDGIYDLLDSNNRKLEIKEAEEGIQIKDLTELPASSVEDVHAITKQAVRLRKTEETSVNKRSSRSHAVIQISLLQRWNEAGETKYLRGVLKVVDLAGSERVSKTESFGNRLEEAKRINKEITTLGKCINNLAQAEKEGISLNRLHVPFRDSKITRFLSQSLDGKSKIVLCVCISRLAIHLQQSFSSLLFATQASTLKVVDSKRNNPYTLGGSVEKKNRSSKEQIEKYVRQLNSEEGDKHIQNKNGEILVDKFKRELSEIENYLSKKEINVKGQSKQALESNLLQMAEIFNLLRGRNDI